MSKEINYVIETSIFGEGKWTLYSLVDTDFGTVPAKNFIFAGTLEECEEKMKQMKELGLE